VHLALLAFAAAALGSLQLLHIRNAIHVDIRLAFAGLAIVHLAQRRQRIVRMFAQLVDLHSRVESELRLLALDEILAFVTADVAASEILDWGRGAPTLLPGLPGLLDRWHLLSSVVFFVYLTVHVSRRWKRIRRSTIRQVTQDAVRPHALHAGGLALQSSSTSALPTEMLGDSHASAQLRRPDSACCRRSGRDASRGG